MFAAWVICWFPSNAGVLSNDMLTTGHHDNKVATSLGVELPIVLQLGVHSDRERLHHLSHESDGRMKVKRRTFWKANIVGPLPVDAIRGRYDGGELNGLGQSRKAMRYG